MSVEVTDCRSFSLVLTCSSGDGKKKVGEGLRTRPTWGPGEGRTTRRSHRAGRDLRTDNRVVSSFGISVLVYFDGTTFRVGMSGRLTSVFTPEELSDTGCRPCDLQSVSPTHSRSLLEKYGRDGTDTHPTTVSPVSVPTTDDGVYPRETKQVLLLPK